MGAVAPAIPRTVVAIATYRRPAALERALEAVLVQVADHPGPASVLVVDNDPEAGAREQVERIGAGAVAYRHEPSPGIAAARNAALRAADGADLLVFLDDDGLPRDGWLDALVSAWCRWDCAGVAGPALTRFEQGEPDQWVLGSGVFDRRTYPSGTLVRGASTSNLLLDLARLRALDLTFDERFGLTGGSDTMLTHTLVLRGGELRWCDEAEVYDYHTADRLTRRWVLRRTRRTSNVWSRVKVSLAGSRGRRLAVRGTLVARSGVRLARGLTQLADGLLRCDPHRQGGGATAVASAVGMAGGALGVVFTEYGRTARSDGAGQPAAGSAGSSTGVRRIRSRIRRSSVRSRRDSAKSAAR